MKQIYFFIVVVWCFQTISAMRLHNDQEAYNYCRTHKKSFIAIIWPIAQGKEGRIKQTLNQYGTIKYSKTTYLNNEQAFTLLKSAHPHITHMHEHVQWYFPAGTFQKPARVFVVTFNDTATAVTCKHAVRRLFPLQYRSIHINDTHPETISLAQFFFHPTKVVFNDSRIALKAYSSCLHLKLGLS